MYDGPELQSATLYQWTVSTSNDPNNLESLSTSEPARFRVSLLPEDDLWAGKISRYYM